MFQSRKFLPEIILAKVCLALTVRRNSRVMEAAMAGRGGQSLVAAAAAAVIL